MPRFGHVLMAYFLIGALAFGGGAIDLNESGIVSIMFTADENGFHPTEQIQNLIEDLKGASIQAIVNVVGGGLLLVWDLLVVMFTAIFWPVSTLLSNNAPTNVTVLLGGGLSVSFLAAGLRFFRSSV